MVIMLQAKQRTQRSPLYEESFNLPTLPNIIFSNLAFVCIYEHCLCYTMNKYKRKSAFPTTASMGYI